RTRSCTCNTGTTQRAPTWSPSRCATTTAASASTSSSSASLIAEPRLHANGPGQQARVVPFLLHSCLTEGAALATDTSGGYTANTSVRAGKYAAAHREAPLKHDAAPLAARVEPVISGGLPLRRAPPPARAGGVSPRGAAAT